VSGFEWDVESMRQPYSLQGIIAEFVACVGPELADAIVIDLDP
jgi:hypothetical protein